MDVSYVARDAFDAANLLELVPGLLEDPEFRLAFVCSLAGGRHDPRDLVHSDRAPGALAVKQQLVPMLQQDGGGSLPDPEELRARISRRFEGAVERLLDWTDPERRFLDRLHDEGVVDAEALHEDAEMQERIRSQPMLLWKAQNVRDFRRGDA